MIFYNNINSFPGRVQASSHNFLSVIFGILGKFGIGIGEQKYFVEKFSSKKYENFLVEKFSGPKIFDFFIEHFSLKKSMKIQNFEISENFRKNEILKF